MILRQKLWLAFVIVTNVLLWAIPSDVIELIARDRQTLLGRYSRTHFTWIVAVAMLSTVTFYIDWSTGEKYKRRRFQVIALALVLFPTLGVVDFLLRRPDQVHYVHDDLAYHRPVESAFDLAFEDRPEAHRTYPDAPAGFGAVQCTLRTDRRGFRNQTDLETYDIVVLGDSFAEGSKVSDEHAWPVRLAERSGKTVYNLGMSGYAPLHYLESLQKYGLQLQPRHVLCMIYEGNDFRSAKSDRKQKRPSFSKRYLKQSPIAQAIDRIMIETFGPMNSTGPVDGMERLDWMPLSIPFGPDAKRYAFAPKQLRDLFISAESFAMNRHWLNPRGQLERMNELCANADCELTVIFAPTKAHITIPLVADRLDAKKVRAFTAISFKNVLPEAEQFLSDLVVRCDAKESVVREWCKRKGIGFISLTKPLRDAVLSGVQAYYTYDQHWTPPGHDVVAQAILRQLYGVMDDARFTAGTGGARPADGSR